MPTLENNTLLATPSSSIFPPDSAPYGVAYKNWLAAYWNWIASIPGNVHPLNSSISYSPEQCTLNQAGPIWFLPAVPQTKETIVRSCTVPAGKAIAFDIETGECDMGIKGMKNDNDLISCATAGNLPQFIAVGLSIDGHQLQNVNQYRVQSDFFNISIPKNNILDSPTGTFRAIASGYFLILKPLPVGKHTINYLDQINNPTETQYNHQKHVLYNLITTP